MDLIRELDGIIDGLSAFRKKLSIYMDTIEGDFDYLRRLLYSDAWPEAVKSDLICQLDDRESQIDRAQGILDIIIQENLKGLKFLDFGCSYGYVPYLVSQQESFAVAYDIEAFESWSKFEQSSNFIATTDFATVDSNGPYDVILLFDVLDHVEEPETVLRQVHSLLKENGRVYVRCHPFMSKTATHLYYELNKAYIHLIFTDEELKLLTQGGLPTKKIIYPLATYRELFELCSFVYKNEHIIDEEVSSFFKNPRIVQRILDNTGHKNFPEFQMSQQFISYKIMKKK